MKRLGVVVLVGLMTAGAHGMSVTVTTERAGGAQEAEVVSLVSAGGVAMFKWPAAKIPADAVRVTVTPDFAMARKGEDGYFVFPGGQLGRYTRTTGAYRRKAPYLLMPVFGMKTPRATWVSIATGRPWGFSLNVEVKDGCYAASHVFDEQPGLPDEDIVIEYRFLEGADADYSGMARAYRAYQLARGACRPLADRAKEHPELDYAVRAPEVRIRLAWKPVPSPVTNQVTRNEPPVKPVVTFDRVRDIVAECVRQDVGRAEFCLVGWNKGGHDGAYPQLFPVEPLLGGEAKLKEAIRFAQEKGYQIVGHGNHRDAYMIADSWDAEYVREKNADGTLKPPRTSWGGGGLYTICAQRAYERFAVKTAAEVATLGFSGLYYLDVTTCHAPYRCLDPRHPMTPRECARWDSAILELQRRTFGGVASEGANDAYIGAYDSALTVNWEKPFEKKAALIDEYVPFWQLVYHGIVLSTPFRTTINCTANPDRRYALKLAEFGGRPTYYWHSWFVTGRPPSMGTIDLRATTDDELRQGVAWMKIGFDDYTRRSDLQYHFMDRHEKVAENVCRVTYSNGAQILVNYNETPATVGSVVIPPLDWTRSER